MVKTLRVTESFMYKSLGHNLKENDCALYKKTVFQIQDFFLHLILLNTFVKGLCSYMDERIFRIL